MPAGLPRPGSLPLARSDSGWSWWLLPPVALGAFLRLFRLGPQLLLYDELHAPRTLVELDLPEILTTYLPSDNSIPLTALYELLVENGVALSELHLRLPAIVAGLLSLVVVPGAVGRRLGRQAGLWAAWLVAISPALIFYSRLARSYMPVVLLVFVAAMAFERWWRTGSVRAAAGSVIAGAAAAWTHLGAGPIVAAPFLWAAAAKAARPRQGRSLGAIALLGLGLAAGFAAFLLPAWESFTALLGDKSGAARPTAANLVQALELQAGAAEGWAAAVFWVGAALGLGVLLRRRPAFGSLTATLVAANLAALLVTAPFGVEAPMILSRYLLVGLPFVLAWAAAGLAA
ncbi:MAG TPA: glycosyltransferase family 39 protein, partial [Thermoanaerobaculia bacterium]